VEAEFEDWARSRMRGLIGAAYLLTTDQHAAEDLVQNTLERVALSWRRIDSPDAYARQVLHRQAIRRWRRRSTTVERPVADPPDWSSNDQSAGTVDRIVLTTALRRLTVAQRRVLVLRYFEDLTETDTAIVLGCSVGTVKSQTHKALNALRAAAPELQDLREHKVIADA
jgi:RNA polymerase sigma-70 factor (sigma-E family)